MRFIHKPWLSGHPIACGEIEGCYFIYAYTVIKFVDESCTDQLDKVLGISPQILILKPHHLLSLNHEANHLYCE